MPAHSIQACSACKKHKRRCDKALPVCSLCRRTRRDCTYDAEPAPVPTPADWAHMQARLAALESILPTTSVRGADSSQTTTASTSVPPSTVGASSHDEANSGKTLAPSTVEGSVGNEGQDTDAVFPASLFLDIDCYVWSHARLPVIAGGIPAHVLEILCRENTIINIAHQYFNTIHLWLPVVSKNRMDTGLSVQNAGPDLAMLFLAMKLITAPFSDKINDSLYRTAKGYLSNLESGGALSLQILQAMVLIAVYEYGHAIYPAAWMTVGSCVRYSDMLGLASGDFTILGQLTTWTEAEERRRVWWSVFVLDKIVALGSRRRCLIPEPTSAIRLPVDDNTWDLGAVSKAVGHPSNTQDDFLGSGFALLCQASILLGRAIRHARVGPPSSISHTEIIGLSREINEFASALDDRSLDGMLETPSLLAPRFVARSALFVLLDRFTCPEKLNAAPGYLTESSVKTMDDLELQTECIQTLEATSQQLHTMSSSIMLAVRGLEDEAVDLSEVSLLNPFIMDAIYAGAASFRWLERESGSELHARAAKHMEKLLDVLNARWKLAGAYRNMLALYDIDDTSTYSLANHSTGKEE